MNTYSFSRESEGSCITYQFETSNNIAYSVYFCSDNYNDYFKNYPYLLNNAFDFGFFPVPHPQDNKYHDPKVFSTILNIVKDFIEFKGDNIELLFHCFDEDDRQHFRGRLFNIWANNSESIKLLKSKIIEVKDENGISHFIGYSVLDKNKQMNTIELEFESFSDSLISNTK